MSVDERPRAPARPTRKRHYNSLPRTCLEGALDNICDALGDCYDKDRSRRSKVPVQYGGTEVLLDQYSVILRLKGVSMYQAPN